MCRFSVLNPAWDEPVQCCSGEAATAEKSSLPGQEAYEQSTLTASDLPAEFGGANGVGHEHGDGERAYAAGDRGVGAGLREGRGMDVSDNHGTAFLESGLAFGVAGEIALEIFAGGDAVDADIDERCARGDHLRGNKARATDGGNEDFRFAGSGGKIVGFGVADRYRCVLREQEHGDGLADDVTAADDHRAGAGDR